MPNGPVDEQSLRTRIADLLASDPTLSQRHAERIATLEAAIVVLHRESRTDVVTGLLSERAQREDEAAVEGTWMALQIDDVQLAYDRCGHKSGNQFVSDLTKLMAEGARACGVRLYRMGTSKFAAFSPDAERIKAFSAIMDALKPKEPFDPTDLRSPMERALDKLGNTGSPDWRPFWDFQAHERGAPVPPVQLIMRSLRR